MERKDVADAFVAGYGSGWAACLAMVAGLLTGDDPHPPEPPPTAPYREGTQQAQLWGMGRSREGLPNRTWVFEVAGTAAAKPYMAKFHPEPTAEAYLDPRYKDNGQTGN